MKIIAIARNYTAHAKELGGEVADHPVFFMKPETALLRNNQPFYVPDFSDEVHYEVEIVVKIKKPGKSIPQEFAYRYYDEIGIGIDFTARDVQRKCITEGLPWEICKAFDYSTPIGKFLPVSRFQDINNINFRLEHNDKIVQQGNTSQMVFNIDCIISHVSKFVTLKIGDLIYTGTPKGVGPVKIGDRLVAFIENEKLLDFNIK